MPTTELQLSGKPTWACCLHNTYKMKGKAYAGGVSVLKRTGGRWIQSGHQP